MNVVLFSRVSSLSQDYQRQVEELEGYCKKMRYKILKRFEEKVSGRKDKKDRPGYSALLEFLEVNKVDKVLTWELSRLGRNSLEILQTLHQLSDKKIGVYIYNFNLETLDHDKKFTPTAQMITSVLSTIGQLEWENLRTRLRSGYEHYRKSGGQVGRKEGSVKTKEMVLQEHKDVAKLLKQGYSVRKVMKLTDKASGTVQKVKRLIS